ncbi:TlpA family protein disulfide reductase [Pedobacter frigiditerrae]|uniref:TlpA family protein disulfide reductase n=1 Tax=Pedobacter frigiditerrae TaxID=2530452 RepID=A0A4V2MII8_9SPHI|nr:TlpA disulfide reductase family protein [Pedobacter frigiditerrae]TCC90546.1 TlpA family protein disulfide reductase [Pedobacter frigiditerrae]
MKYVSILLLVSTFSFANAQVKLLTLSELDKRVAKGKDTTYVINFWATWCAPCVAELPNFERLKKEYYKTPVKVILVSMDFKSKLKSDVIPFVKKHRLKSEVYVVDEKDQQAFIEKVDKNWSGAIPATLIAARTRRLFFEKEFANNELEDLVKSIVHGDYKL